MTVAERDLAELAEKLSYPVFTFSLPDTLRSVRSGVAAAWDYDVFSVAINR